MIYVDTSGTTDLFIPRDENLEYTPGGTYEDGYRDGYSDGYGDGFDAGKSSVIWQGTQEEYEALPSHDNNVLYIISCDD